MKYECTAANVSANYEARTLKAIKSLNKGGIHVKMKQNIEKMRHS